MLCPALASHLKLNTFYVPTWLCNSEFLCGRCFYTPLQSGLRKGSRSHWLRQERVTGGYPAYRQLSHAVSRECQVISFASYPAFDALPSSFLSSKAVDFFSKPAWFHDDESLYVAVGSIHCLMFAAA